VPVFLRQQFGRNYGDKTALNNSTAGICGVLHRFNSGMAYGNNVVGNNWRWPDRNLAGNAIDFYTNVLGVSFHDAMKELTGK